MKYSAEGLYSTIPNKHRNVDQTYWIGDFLEWRTSRPPYGRTGSQNEKRDGSPQRNDRLTEGRADWVLAANQGSNGGGAEGTWHSNSG